jgi:putative membrane protein
VSMGDPRLRMANERTFLAWLRTGVSLMAFGFVVERFALFLKKIGYLLNRDGGGGSQGYSSVFGILLVCLGAFVTASAFIRYRKTERQIAEGKFESSLLLNTILTVSILVISILLAASLIISR